MADVQAAAEGARDRRGQLFCGTARPAFSAQGELVVVADLAKREAVEITDPMDREAPDISDEYANLLKKVLDGIQSL